jgi:hypothetical protein
MGLPERPGANTTVQDILRFEQTARVAAPYLTTRQAGNVAANREMVRRMWTYLAGMDLIARTAGGSGLGPAIGRARGTLMGLGLAYPYWLAGIGLQGGNEPTPPPVPVKLEQPPFALQAPDLGEVGPTDQSEADELTGRYESAAANASAAWQSADVLRQSLAARAMSLNSRITASLTRMQLFLESAARDMRKHRWQSAKENLERAEYMTVLVTNSVGK